MTRAEELAKFVVQASYEDLSGEAVRQLKIRILDSLGCAIGALAGEPIGMLKDQIEDFGGNPLCTLIGSLEKSAADRAALYNGALVRYLDFNDSFLAPKETCHPSDNLGAVMAASEYAGVDGKQLLAALAVAYQVQCRLSEEAPVRDKGFDHTTQGAYAAAAGVSRALDLDTEKTANAIAISGVANNALRVTRTGALSHWKGLAYPNTAYCAAHAAFLAMRGVTGPAEVFEGNKGFVETISGPFEIDWEQENLEAVRHTIVKKYNAEVHSQSALEAVLELRAEHEVPPKKVERIEIDTFDVAYNIIGGGEEGTKQVVRTKEEADHSLPYMIAAALIDGEIGPDQYRPERIAKEDVQDLMPKVEVRPQEEMSRRFPHEMPCRIRVLLEDGQSFETEKDDYEGFHTRPASWESTKEKFELLAAPHTPEELREAIAQTVFGLEEVQVKDLSRLLGQVGTR